MDSELFTILIFCTIILAYIGLLIICTYVKPFRLLIVMFKQIKNIIVILCCAVTHITFPSYLPKYKFKSDKYKPI